MTFFHTLPFGHFKYFPLTFSGNSPKPLSKPEQSGEWLYRGWLEAYHQKDECKPKIERQVFKTCEEVILLPCLDRVYGHSLWRLFNASELLEKHPEKGLILIIPSYLEWLVPEGIAEVWLVQVRPEESLKYLKSLEEFAQRALEQFKQVWLAEAPPQPLHFDIKSFTKIAPFPPKKFTDLPLNITLVWREDRFWLRHFWEQKIFALSQRFAFAKNYTFVLKRQQLRRFQRLIQYLQKALPEAQIHLIGLGRYGQFKEAEDLRSANPPHKATEEIWANICAKSQVVFGVHGSAMILPTALAGGFVELLPDYRLANLADDIASPLSGRSAWFFGRVLAIDTAPQQVARHIQHLLEGAEWFYLQQGNA